MYGYQFICSIAYQIQTKSMEENLEVERLQSQRMNQCCLNMWFNLNPYEKRNAILNSLRHIKKFQSLLIFRIGKGVYKTAAINYLIIESGSAEFFPKRSLRSSLKNHISKVSLILLNAWALIAVLVLCFDDYFLSFPLLSFTWNARGMVY